MAVSGADPTIMLTGPGDRRATQFMTGYIGHGAQDGQTGIEAFLARADELAAAYGDRFASTRWLRDLAASGRSFPA